MAVSALIRDRAHPRRSPSTPPCSRCVSLAGSLDGRAAQLTLQRSGCGKPVSILDEGFRSPGGAEPQPAARQPQHPRVWRSLLLFGILTAASSYMQLINGAEYARRARKTTSPRRTSSRRAASSYDRNGQALVQNVGVYTATVTTRTPAEGPGHRATSIYLQLEKLTRRAGAGDPVSRSSQAEDNEPGLPSPSKSQKYLTHRAGADAR